VRHFGDAGAVSRGAVENFVQEVKGGGFPEVGKETYAMKKEEWTKFLEMTKKEQ
jgi:ketopantoate hydroxymethyltransferase